MRSLIIFTLLVLLTINHSQGQTTSNYRNAIGRYGVALPMHQVMLRSKVTGQIEDLSVDEGQWVKKGDVLCRLHAEEAIARKEIAKREAESVGGVETAKAELGFAEVQLARIAGLFANAAANQSEYDEAKLQFQRAQARLKSEQERLAVARARYQLAEAELQNYSIRAPFDGYVHQIKGAAGQTITSADDILELVSLEKLRIELFLPFSWKEKLVVGSSHQVQIAAPFKSVVDATVTYQSQMIESTSKTVRFVFEIDNRELKLPAGVIVSPNHQPELTQAGHVK